MDNISQAASEIDQIILNLRIEFSGESIIKQSENISGFIQQLKKIQYQLDSELNNKWKWRIESLKSGLEDLKNNGVQTLNSAIGFAGAGLWVGGSLVSLLSGGMVLDISSAIGEATYNYSKDRNRDYISSKLSLKDKIIILRSTVDSVIEKAELLKSIAEEIIQDLELIRLLEQDKHNEGIVNFLDIDNQIKQSEEFIKVVFSFGDYNIMTRQLRNVQSTKIDLQLIQMNLDSGIKNIESKGNAINSHTLKNLLILLGSSIQGIGLNSVGNIALNQNGNKKTIHEINQNLIEVKTKIDTLIAEANEKEQFARKCLRDPAYMKKLARRQRLNKLHEVIYPIVFCLFIASITLLFTDLRVWSITTLLGSIALMTYSEFRFTSIFGFIGICASLTLLLTSYKLIALILFLVSIFCYSIPKLFNT